MRSPSCMYLCLSLLSTFELVGRFSEIKWGGHAIEIGLHTIIFNPVASTIQKLRAFKLLRWMQKLPQSSWDHEILYADRSSEDKQLWVKPLLQETKKYERDGRLKYKIHILLNDIWYNERSRTCQQVLFESLFSLTELLSMALVGFSKFRGKWKIAPVSVVPWHFWMLRDLQSMNSC
jgi:hypothetical protein